MQIDMLDTLLRSELEGLNIEDTESFGSFVMNSTTIIEKEKNTK